MVLHGDIDLLNPTAELEKKKHKSKRLVPTPNSSFLDVKCPGCLHVTTVFSHAQSVVSCAHCRPTGGRAKLTEGCFYAVKEKPVIVLGSSSSSSSVA